MQATTTIDDWLILKSFVFLIERKQLHNPGQRGLFYADIKYLPWNAWASGLSIFDCWQFSSVPVSAAPRPATSSSPVFHNKRECMDREWIHLNSSFTFRIFHSFPVRQNIDGKLRARGCFYLNNFDYEDEREGEEGRYQEEWDGREKMSEHTRALVTGWNIGDITGNR